MDERHSARARMRAVPAFLPHTGLFTLLLAVAAVTGVGIVALTSQPVETGSPVVNVRWASEVTEAQRAIKERQHQLAEPVWHGSEPGDRGREGRTWSYSMTDTSGRNVQALVLDPAVEDTSHIDRERYAVNTAGPRPAPGRRALFWSGCVLFVAWFAAWFGMRPGSRIGDVLTRGIPELSAEALGLFRLFFAGALLLAMSQYAPIMDGRTIDEQRRLSLGWINWLLLHPQAVGWLEDAILTLIVLFGLGVLTRISYALVAAGLTVWLAVLVQLDTNLHAWEAAFLTVLCLLPVPWGEALSVDAWWRRRAAPVTARRGKGYGFAVWIPGFVLGALWLSAAYTKLEASGLDWILGGAVKYHWVIDAPSAAVDWGLWVASHHWVAVLMSFGGVALEAAFLAAAFITRERVKSAVACAMGLPLLVGFFLFHGLFWWPWWLALLSFGLPWQSLADRLRLDPRGLASETQSGEAVTKAPSPVLRPVHAVLICLLCMAMVRPLPAGAGRFTAYSNTYASTDAFDERFPGELTTNLWSGYGTPGERVAFEGAAEADVLTDLMLRRVESGSTSERLFDRLKTLAARLSRKYGLEGKTLTLVRERTAFDWTEGRFLPREREVLATFDLQSFTLEPPAQP